MMKFRTYLSVTFLLTGLFFSSISFAQVQPVVYQTTVTGRLTPAEYDSVRTVIKKMVNQQLKDTVVLKYEYDKMPAQPANGVEADELIQQNITEELRMLHREMTRRKNISILYFASAGNQAAQIQKDNNTLEIDKTGLLNRLLFSNANGINSMLLLPDRTFIAVPSADGWGALQLSATEMAHADIGKINKKEMKR